MATLISNRQWSEFKALMEQGIGFKGCEIFEGTIYKGTFIPNNPYDFEVGSSIRLQAEHLAVRANSALPQSPDKSALPQPILKFPNLAKARATRQANLAKRKEGG